MASYLNTQDMMVLTVKSPKNLFLIHTVFNQQRAIAEQLISKGANVNYAFNGVTPLIAAVEGENKEIIELILRNGANPRLKTYIGTYGETDAINYARRMVKNEYLASLLERN